MALINFKRCWRIICNFSLPNTKKFKFWISNELLCKIAFTYVTFAAIWNGRYYVIAIDYEYYVIFKHCPVDSNQRKYVLWVCFKNRINWNILGASQISEKTSIQFVVPLRPSVGPHRITRLPLDGLSKKYII